MSVRSRFAPSPTGYLHVGSARTALYSYLYAKAKGGKFILRIEDTDQARSTEAALKMQIEDLVWLKLLWDEGPDEKTLNDIGKFGPYRQSHRLPIYKKYADELLAKKKAFYCFCTDEELEVKRQAAMKAGKPPHYDGTCRDGTIDEAKKRVAAGEKGSIRFRITHDHEVRLNDLVRGEVVFPAGTLGDFIILRSDGMPVYNFCCVVDDAMMEMTHVLRADDHLTNTLRQLLLYEALGLKVPAFGHLSMILDSDRQKLSKRKGASSCNEFMKLGFLPEAMLNFLVLLGWSSPKGQEILSMQEMIEQFDVDRINAAPAVFDETKLRWFNAHYLRGLPHEELWKRVKPFLDNAGLKFSDDVSWIDRALAVMKTSMETLADAVELFRPLSHTALEFNDEAREVLKWESSPAVIKKWQEKVENFKNPFISSEEFDQIINSVKDECNVKGKFLFMPTRVAIIGKPHGAELKQLVPLLDKKVLVERAQSCFRS